MLPFARDVGVRFIIARNTAGAGRALYELVPPAHQGAGRAGRACCRATRCEGDILGGVRPRPMPAGRGLFVSRRRGNPLVQTGLVDGGR